MKRYLACTTSHLERMARPQLFALMQEAFPGVTALDTRANMIEQLKRARQEHWDRKAGAETPKKAKAKPDLITAAEANAWLRTLPRMEPL